MDAFTEKNPIILNVWMLKHKCNETLKSHLNFVCNQDSHTTVQEVQRRASKWRLCINTVQGHKDSNHREVGYHSLHHFHAFLHSLSRKLGAQPSSKINSTPKSFLFSRKITQGYWSHTCSCPSWYRPCLPPLVPSSLGLNQNPFPHRGSCITLLLLLPTVLSLAFLSLLHFQKQQDILVAPAVVFLKKWSPDHLQVRIRRDA